MSLFLLATLVHAQDTTAPDEESVVDDPIVEEPTGPDRSGSPPVADPVPLSLDDLQKHTLDSGLEVWHVRIPRVRDVAVTMRWWQGSHELIGHSPEAVRLMGELWGIASEKYDATALSQLEDLNDMSVYGSVDDHLVTVRLDVPLENLETGLDLMADVALHPVFTKREVKLRQEETHRWLTADGPKSLGAVASAAQGHAWIPPDHPYGRRLDLDAYMDVHHKDLPAVHQALIVGRPLTLLVVGDLSFDAIKPSLEKRFGDLIPADDKRAKPLTIEAPAATRVIAIDMPDSDQVGIRLRMALPAILDPERLTVGTTTWALGGHFLARFNKNLREDKGWTYGVRSGYTAGRTYGMFNVKVDVPADTFAPAVTELERELEIVGRDGITSAELDAGWRGSVKSFNDTRGTTGSAAGFYSGRLFYEQSVADRVAELAQQRAVTPEAAKTAAKKWLGADAPRLWIVAGPRAAIEAGLETLGWEANWVSAEDALLGRFE